MKLEQNAFRSCDSTGFAAITAKILGAFGALLFLCGHSEVTDNRLEPCPRQKNTLKEIGLLGFKGLVGFYAVHVNNSTLGFSSLTRL